MNRRKNSWISKITTYIKTHYSFRTAFITLVLLVCVAFVFSLYLQRQYLDYLNDEIRTSDTTTLHIETEYIESEITSLIENGSTSSLKQTLYETAGDYANNRGDVALRLKLNNELQDISRQFHDLIDVAIATKEGELLFQVNKIYGGTNTDHYFWNEKNNDKLQNLCSNLEGTIVSGGYPRYSVSSEPSNYSVIARDVEVINSGYVMNIAFALPGNVRHSEDYSAVLVMSFNVEAIEDFINNINKDSKGFSTAYITDVNNNIVFSADKDETMCKFEPGNYAKNYELLTESITNPKWDLIIMINKDGMEEYIYGIYMKGFLFYLLAIAVIVAIQFLLTWQALRPVYYIHRAMDSVKAGKLDTHMEIHGENELWQLAENYNEMVDSLVAQRVQSENENHEKIQLISKAAKAEMKALQSQINAHFLCNTLNAINYSAIEKGDDDVAEMIYKLSNIMRYVYSNNDDYITLGDEIEWVDQYLSLQKFRLMDAFSYRIEYKEVYSEWPCCKLFLQPFVENAIKHGFFEKETGGTILIKVEAADDRIRIFIDDNGIGMDKAKEDQIRSEINRTDTSSKGDNVGLQNVIARLKLFYGKGFEIELSTEKGRGTEFTLYLPIPKRMIE